MNVGHRTGLSWSFSFWGKGFGLERQDCGLYPFCAGSLAGLDSSAEHGSPGVERADPPGPSSLPIVRHRWSASTSFVLAALRALHVDPSYAVTKSAMIEEGTSSPWTWHFARTYRTPPSGRGNYGPGSPNRPTFMPGGPEFRVRTDRLENSSGLKLAVRPLGMCASAGSCPAVGRWAQWVSQEIYFS